MPNCEKAMIFLVYKHCTRKSYCHWHGHQRWTDERLQAHSFLGLSNKFSTQIDVFYGKNNLLSKFLQITRPKKQRLLVSWKFGQCQPHFHLRNFGGFNRKDDDTQDAWTNQPVDQPKPGWNGARMFWTILSRKATCKYMINKSYTWRKSRKYKDSMLVSFFRFFRSLHRLDMTFSVVFFGLKLTRL